jgi:hypothetical protein
MIGADIGWKHLTRQLPISGQNFCGQSGCDLSVLWQGMSSAVPDIAIVAEAPAAVNGMTVTTLSMANKPRTASQRWNNRFVMDAKWHTSSCIAIWVGVDCVASEFIATYS